MVTKEDVAMEEADGAGEEEEMGQDLSSNDCWITTMSTSAQLTKKTMV